MRSGNVSYANYVYLLGSSGVFNDGSVNTRYAVRPALYSTVINLKSRGYSVLLGLSLEYNAWLRSSGDYYARTAFTIAASGGDSGDYTTARYAVRPALYSTVIN